MRQLGLATLLLLANCGSGETCDPSTACQEDAFANFRFCNAGSSGCYYRGSDGSRFDCRSCGDCQSAQTLALAWCATTPGTTNGNSNGNGGSLGSNCVAQSAGCSAGSYQFCTSATGMSGCGYKSSDGKTFACNSCTDCTQAATDIASWCSGSNTTNSNSSTNGTNGSTNGTNGNGKPPASTECVTTGGSASDCQNCCITAHQAGALKASELVYGCLCPLCPDCADLTQCGGSTTSLSSACSSCIQSNSIACVSKIEPTCDGDPDCRAFDACGLGCS